MPRHHSPEVLSPRALARLRAPRAGFVPTERDLDPAAFAAPWAEEPHDDLDRHRHRRRERVGRGADPGGEAGGDAWSEAGRHGRVHLPRGWIRLPSALVGARWHPARGAVLGVVVVTLLAVAVLGLRVAWARSEGDGTVLAPGGGSRAGPTGVSAGAVPVGVPSGGAGAGSPSSVGATPSAGATATPGGAASGGAASGVVVVHVVGEVRRPGVQRMPVGSRVQDAVEAAGGPTRDADLARVNLARVVVDGEQVRVPAPGDPDPPVGTVTGGAATGGPGAGGGIAGPPGLVSVNTADLAGLDTLPGVGPVLAQRILDWRTQHGRFTSVEELGEVSGIGEKVLAQLRPLVTL